jgi:beta-mannosidase
MRWLFVGTLILTATCTRTPQASVLTITLTDGWEMRRAGDTLWIPATVPGTVHTDLLAAGLIPDPFKGDPEEDLQWIEDESWVYRTRFVVDPRIPLTDRTELVFEGLDTYAQVSLNGRPLLSADNMFRSWRVNVPDVLLAETNVLEVTFRSPTAEGALRASRHPWSIPHQEPDQTGTRAFVRKAAYHFGWDWGPRFVTSGIWRPVRLEAWSGARIRNVHVADPVFETDHAGVRLHIEVETSAGGSARVGARSPSEAFEPVLARVDLRAGLDTVVMSLRIPEPERWWPAGLGEPHLYEVDVDVAFGTAWDHQRHRFGLKSLDLVTEADGLADGLGESFIFRVNGREFFARGANLVPPDHFTPRADSAVYAALLDDVVAANMNMVRVWGGGVYLPDVFYDLADERGVLVWQDFMFANSLVPGDTAFLASVAAEAADQTRRLRNHPSLAMWCGNNEVAEGWANWAWRDAYAPEIALEVEAAYEHLFEEVLPAVVEAHDPSRPYWPSSPSVGWGHAESLTRGDSHYWGVWWGMEPFRAYAEKVPRFASEFGFQALPNPATIEAFAEVAPTRLDEPAMAAHQKHATGYETIATYLARDWPVPPPDSLDAFAYVSQLAQAEGVGLALEAHRRSWPRTGGSLYWQLNDTWPVVSWSSRDYFGRWKALHYRARSIFAPVAVLADSWADSVGVWVATDREGSSGTIEVLAMDMTGEPIGIHSVRFQGSGRVWVSTIADLVPEGTDPRDVIVVASLVGNERPGSRDIAFLVPPGDLSLPDPEVRVVATERNAAVWHVTLTADRFAYGVRLAVTGSGARFSDNYLHILPGDTVTVRVEPEGSDVDLTSRLSLRTLSDVTPN